MSTPIYILIIEDSKDDYLLLTRAIQRGGYDAIFEQVDTANAMIEALERQTWDIIISDYSMPLFSAPEALQILHENELDVPFIIVSGKIGEETAVSLMRAGANDYIHKDNLMRLIPAIKRELKEAHERRMHDRAKKALEKSEEQLRLVIEASLDAVIVVDQLGNIKLFNYAAEELFLYKFDEVLNKPAKILLCDAVAETHQKRLESFLRKGMGQCGHIGRRMERTFKRKDGSHFIAEVAMSGGRINSIRLIVITINDITERKRAEKALHDSEQKYRTMIEQSNDLIWTLNIQGNLTYINNKIENLTGYKFTELEGKNYTHMLLPEDIPKIEEKFFDILKGNCHHQCMVNIRKKDGSILVLSINTAPIYESHEIVGTVSFGRDITEQKQIEERLKQSEKKYRTLIENIQDGVILIQDGDIQYINDAFSKMFGYSEVELLGLDFQMLMVPEDREIVQNLYQKHSDEYVPKEFEFQGVKKDGELITIYANFGLISLDGKVALIGTLKDITESKKAENLLRESEERNRSLLLAIPDLIFRLSKDGIFLDFKPSNTEDPLVPPSEFVGQNMYKVLPDLAPLFDYNINLALQTRDIQLFEYQVTREGRLNDYEARLLADRKDEVLVIVRNITERKLSENLRLENDRLVTISKAKSKFLAMVSHELRTPLTSIIGFSKLLEQKKPGNLNKEQERFVNNILNNGEHLLNLINDVLEMSKIEVEKIELVIEKISLLDFLNETLDLIKEQAVNRYISFESNIEPQIEMEVDKVRFRQILLNLLSNAMKFSKMGEENKITISAKKYGDMVQFSISDTGIGIKENELKNVFNMFYQVDSDLLKNHKGTGMGLAITKKLVEMHRGTISADSKPGVGTTFTFSLPLKQIY